MKIARLCVGWALMGAMVIWLSGCRRDDPMRVATCGPQAIAVSELRCEDLVEPLGIDTAAPRLSWKLESPAGVRGQKQTAWQVVATRQGLDPARPVESWDSGKVVSDQSVYVPYAGPALGSNDRVTWKVRVWDKDDQVSPWSATACFVVGLLEPGDWQGRWICHPTASETKHLWYRRDVDLPKVPAEGWVHVASIGYHELYINGQRADDRVLAPVLSNLEKRVYAVSYRVTGLLRPGTNVIALWTGPGWARADGSFGKPVWKQPALLKCQVDLGEGVFFGTDGSWKCRESCSENLGLWKGGGQGECGGEQIDARMDRPDWNLPGADLSDWSQASIVDKELIITPQMLEPDRMVETIHPQSLTSREGAWTFDLGRNFTGWIELKLRHGREGQVVRITTANREGPLIEFNQESRYIHNASGEGVFRHRFNYTAGRWITVWGLDEAPQLGDLCAHVVTNDRLRFGRFECSDPLFNRIYQTDLRTYLANTVNGVTMDCPHRERYGYGEIVLACSWGCGIPHFDSAPFYRKVARDWHDVQREDGFVNTIAPQVYRGAGGTLWSSAPVTLAHEAFLAYGDRRQLEDAYEPMKRWIDYLGRSVGGDGVLVAYEQASRFLGDWATPHGSEYGNTPAAQLFNNCVYAYDLMVIIEAAKVLGCDGDARHYQQQLDALRINVHRHFYNRDTRNYIDGRQLSMAFPLYVGITPPEEREAVMKGFLEEITLRKPYLDTGSSGLPILLKFLVEHAGRTDVLATCLKREEQPGYGYFLKRGESTWPEYWQIDGNDSRIHTCYTGISGFFTRGIGGIRPDPRKPGMQHFLLKPSVVGDLTDAHTTGGSLYGTIVSNWRRDGSTTAYEFEVPVNTTASVFLPAASIDAIREGGLPVAQAPCVKHVSAEAGCQIFEIESGRYVFEVSEK